MSWPNRWQFGLVAARNLQLLRLGIIEVADVSWPPLLTGGLTMKNLLASIALAATMLLAPQSATAQTWTYYPPTGQTFVQYATPVTTSYYVDPATGATYSYAVPTMTYVTPGPRVFGPGRYYSYSPAYYSPSLYYGTYSYPTYTYYPGYTTYYRTWNWVR
jgi:hypothetical protein